MPTASGSDVKQFLLKFRGDLASLKENQKDIERMVSSMGSMLKRERDKSASEAKAAHTSNLQQVRELADVQAANARADLAATNAKAAVARAQAQAELQRMQVQRQQIALAQQELALKRQQIALERGGGSGGEGTGIGKILTSFTGAATGGGLLNSLVAGAAGGGMFFIFEKLSETIGNLVRTWSELPTKAGEIAEKLEQMAAKAGVSAQQLQELRLAGASVNLPMERMSRALMMMNLQFTRVGTGVSKSEKELARFGVSIRDASGNVLPTTEIIKRVSDLFLTLPDGMTKSRLAADLFTRRIGSQMIPLLNQGSDAIQSLYDRSDKYSILLNEDLLKAQRAMKVENEALKMQWEKLEVTLGAGLLPKLVQFVGLINDAVDGLNNLVGADAGNKFTDAVNLFAAGQAIKEGMAKGPGEYPLKKFSEAGKNKMGTEIPQDVKDKLIKEFSYSDTRMMAVGDKHRTWQDAVDLLGAVGSGAQSKEVQRVIELFTKQYPEALEVAGEATNKLDKRLQDNSKTAAKLQQTILKYNETLAQMKEKQELAAVEDKKFGLKVKYDEGLVSQQSYNEQVKLFDKEEYDAKVKYINEWATIEKQKLQNTADLQRQSLVGEVEDAAEQQDKLGLIASETAEKIKIVELQKTEKLLDAKKNYNKASGQLDLELILASQKAAQIRFQTELKLKQDQIEAEKSLLDYQVHQGIVSQNDYLQKRIVLINREVQVAKEAAEEEYKNSKKTAEALAQEQAKILEAQAKGEKDYTALVRGEAQSRVGASQSRYQGFMGIAQNQLSTAQLMPGASGVDSARSAMMQIISLTKAYRDEQSNLLKQVTPLSEEWFKIFGNIQKATEELIKMNLELLKSKSVLVNAGGILQQLSGVIGQVGISRGGWESIGAAGTVLDTLGTARAKRKAAGKDEGAGVFSDMTDAFKGFDWHKLGESMQKFHEGMKGAIAAVGGFIQQLGTSHGHAGDILGGAMSGAGLGGSIGNLFSSFSKFAGPIGQVAGMAFGGVLSAIIGKKNNATAEFINSVNKQMQELQASISNGTTGLQQGIQQLQALRSSVISQEGHSKKKQRQQLEQEAQSIQDQIIALQQQQEAMFVDLRNQLKVLNAPTAFQGLLGSLKDIMDQYKKFAGAARDAKDLALANEFLADSLRNFADTQNTALNQAEQTAIQDAIKLNDLIRDRQNLLTEEAQTEYDIMTQGVLVNQRTVAMTKMQQIQQARYNMNLQLEQMNQEIKLTDYKVTHEREIFQLASTRIDLEAQLLVLQEAQTDKDMLRIRALQQIVQMINSGTPLTNMDQVIAALFGSVKTPTGNNSNPSGMASGIENLLNDIRSQRSREGNNNFSGYLYT